MKKFILSICDHPIFGRLLGAFGRATHKREYLLGLRNPFHLSTFVIEREDSHYITNADSYLFLSSPQGARMAFDGSDYETDISFLMRKLVRPGDVVLDIGANVGLHTVFLSGLVGNGRVIAFEPVSEMADRLSANCAFNRADNVTLIRSALGEETGEATIQANLGDPGMEGTNSMIASVHVANRPDRYEERTISVKRLDDIAAGLGISDRINFVKIDTEGFEPMVIRGALETLRKTRPALLVEAHSNRLKEVGLNFGWYTETFADYHIYIIHPVTPANPFLNLQPLEGEPPEIAVNLLLLPKLITS
ncbi:FkbM family methyltransferase [Thalassospiraceae bacterium LMO-JJ14]|nr:FkbM family methyltransferase [Thalassospiraceae bacterium LMO-JJ14]